MTPAFTFEQPIIKWARDSNSPTENSTVTSNPFYGFSHVPVILALIACVFYIHIRALTSTYVSALAVSVGQTTANVPFFLISVVLLEGTRTSAIKWLGLLGVLAAGIGYAIADGVNNTASIKVRQKVSGVGTTNARNATNLKSGTHRVGKVKD